MAEEGGHKHRNVDRHGHVHAHAPADFGSAFVIGAVLNVTFVAIEATYGFISNSTALLADAGHNLSDILGLVVAWVAVGLSKRTPTASFTYGLRSSSILAALFNAMLLMVAVGAIAWEAVQRIWEPEPVAGMTVIVVATIGIVINGFTAWLFAGGGNDINIRGAFLHFAADAAVSAGVVGGGVAMVLLGWPLLDPIISLAICAVILSTTWGLLKDSVRLSLAAVPRGIDPAQVRAFLKSQPGVEGVHDLHIWPISTTDIALTCHLVMPGGHPGDGFLVRTAHDLEHAFAIGHVTIQVEIDEATECNLRSEMVV